MAVTRLIFVASCAAAALTLSAARAGAQKHVFVEGLTELTAAVEGTFGDEGVRVGPALDRMAAGLAEWDRAIRAYEARLTTDLPDAPQPTALQTHVTLGKMYVERGRLADALRELDAATRLDPRRADLYTLRGLVLDALARSAEAAEAFRTAWDLDTGNPIAAYLVFHHAVTTGNTRDAHRARETLSAAYRRLLQDRTRAKASPFLGIGLFRDGAADTPVLPPVAYARGYAHIARGQYDEAIAEFRKAAATDPLAADPAARSASIVRAVAALRQGRLAEARALFEGSTALHESSEAHRMLGLTYWADAQYEKSIEQLEIASRANPLDERSRVALARVLTWAGRDADAERALQETIHVLPDSALARWWLGWSYERLNRFDDARREFERVAAGAVAGRSRLFASVGRLASSAADVPGAVEAFARSVNANPNDPVAHRQLAGAFLLEDRADEAFVEFVAALLIDPLDAESHDGIGRIHLNAGRYDEAVTALRRAVDLSKGHAGTRYALATALTRLGNTQEAARELELFEQTQRETLANRRRTMALDVLREEAALRAAEGGYDRAAALWQRVIDREPGRSSNHLGLAAALAGGGQTDAAIHQYEVAAELDATPEVYRQLAALYAKVGRIEDSARARAMYDRALQGLPTRGAAR